MVLTFTQLESTNAAISAYEEARLLAKLMEEALDEADALRCLAVCLHDMVCVRVFVAVCSCVWLAPFRVYQSMR